MHLFVYKHNSNDWYIVKAVNKQDVITKLNKFLADFDTQLNEPLTEDCIHEILADVVNIYNDPVFKFIAITSDDRF